LVPFYPKDYLNTTRGFNLTLTGQIGVWVPIPNIKASRKGIKRRGGLFDGRKDNWGEGLIIPHFKIFSNLAAIFLGELSYKGAFLKKGGAILGDSPY